MRHQDEGVQQVAHGVVEVRGSNETLDFLEIYKSKSLTLL
jgi:hypothetical protein